jgi:hypothetical protein
MYQTGFDGAGFRLAALPTPLGRQIAAKGGGGAVCEGM